MMTRFYISFFLADGIARLNRDEIGQSADIRNLVEVVCEDGSWEWVLEEGKGGVEDVMGVDGLDLGEVGEGCWADFDGHDGMFILESIP